MFFFHQMTDVPYEINGMISEWPASKWTPDVVAESLQDLKLEFRIGPKTSQGNI